MVNLGYKLNIVSMMGKGLDLPPSVESVEVKDHLAHVFHYFRKTIQLFALVPDWIPRFASSLATC